MSVKGIAEICGLIGMVAVGVAGYHTLDLRSDREKQADMHVEAIVSRVNRLCRIKERMGDEFPSDLDRTLRSWLVKYEKATGRAWTGECND